MEFIGITTVCEFENIGTNCNVGIHIFKTYFDKKYNPIQTIPDKSYYNRGNKPNINWLLRSILENIGPWSNAWISLTLGPYF